MAARKLPPAKKRSAKRSAPATPRRNGDAPRVVLLLQGGGALGAYHIGAYQALHESGMEPDWIAGVSIGAFNACILAGNAPSDRLARIEGLWDTISRPESVEFWTSIHGLERRIHNAASHVEAVLLGQPNFFYPRFPSPQFVPDQAPEDVSFYVSTPMLGTLRELADFDRINARQTRLSVGATHVKTGTLIFFDNDKQVLTPEHILASGSLPPGLPGTRIDGELFWDGGCVSNTPLDVIFDEPFDGHTIVFMIDLWSSLGKEPRNMDELRWRQNDILYASRSTHRLISLAARHNLQHALLRLKARDPDSEVAVASVSAAHEFRTELGSGTFDIMHITYQPPEDEIPDAGADFSRASIQARRTIGHRDMKRCLEARPWAATDKPALAAASIHHYRGGEITTHHPF
jgi:NTE family protein